MRTNNRVPYRATRGAMLADDACPRCGKPMREGAGRLKLPVNGEEITVPDATHLRCPSCREVVLRFDDARGLRRRALEITSSVAHFWRCVVLANTRMSCEGRAVVAHRGLRQLHPIVGPPARPPCVALHAKCRTTPPNHRDTPKMRAAMLKKTIQDR